jgi:polar amino acid transport system substrate-binding protein
VDSEPLVRRRGLITTSFAGLAAASALTAVPAIGFPRAEAAPTTNSRLDRIVGNGKIRVGQFLQYKPFGFKNPNGEPDGFDVDLTKTLAADMGVQPEFIDNTWDGIIPALLADKFDVITANMAITAKRALVVQFANPINFVVQGFIYRSEDAGRFSSLQKFNDPGVTISTLIQDASHVILPRFFPKAKIQDFNSAEEAILAVQTKKMDCSIANLSFLAQYALEHKGLTIKAVDYPGTQTAAGMALGPGPENDHLKRFIDTWVQLYYWSGKFEALWKKWVPWNPIPKIEKFMAPV